MTSPADPPSQPTEPPGPVSVSRFEFNLLRLMRFLLGHMPVEQATPLVTTKFVPCPPCLSRSCVRLAQDTLAKGLVLFLVRSGGWRRERFLRGNQPTDGRAWDRTPLDDRRLTFSRHVLGFLVWLTAEKPTDTKDEWDAPAGELTPADELFFALALDALRPLNDVNPVLTGKMAFRGNPFCWLSAPSDFSATDDPVPPDFGPMTRGNRAAILECLQPWLTQRWLRAERAKGQIGDWRRMRQQGRAELATLSSFLTAVERAGRPDLARFVLRTASTLLGGSGDPSPAYWTGGLQGTGPLRLADRLDTQRAALALPRQLDTLQRWDRQARSVGYFDEEYPSSQLWKADWESARGDEVAARARRLLEQLEPLRT